MWQEPNTIVNAGWYKLTYYQRWVIQIPDGLSQERKMRFVEGTLATFCRLDYGDVNNTEDFLQFLESVHSWFPKEHSLDEFTCSTTSICEDDLKTVIDAIIQWSTKAHLKVSKSTLERILGIAISSKDVVEIYIKNGAIQLLGAIDYKIIPATIVSGHWIGIDVSLHLNSLADLQRYSHTFSSISNLTLRTRLESMNIIMLEEFVS